MMSLSSSPTPPYTYNHPAPLTYPKDLPPSCLRALPYLCSLDFDY